MEYIECTNCDEKIAFKTYQGTVKCYHCQCLFDIIEIGGMFFLENKEKMEGVEIKEGYYKKKKRY